MNPQALEEFHAERMAGRILGMGDVVSLVEKAQQEVSEEEALAMQKKMEKGELTMEDFLSQMKTLRRMGPLKQLLGLLPGVGSALKDVNIDEKHMDKIEAMINSMTLEERRNPDIINPGRKQRIAKGSGKDISELNQFLKQFEQMKGMMKMMNKMPMGKMPGMGRK